MSEVSNQGQSSSIPTESLQSQPTVHVVPIPISSHSQHGSTATSPVPSKSSTPDNPTHAPRFGTLIANRIFVGGITYDTNDSALKEYFSKFGHVKEAKIICDRAGVSKGYGFITFETQEEATRIQDEYKNSNNLIFRDKKLNIGPAVRKQQTYSKNIMDAVPYSNGMVVHNPGYSYTYQNGMAYFHGDNPLGNAQIPHATIPPAGLYQPYPFPIVMQPPAQATQYLPAPQAPQFPTPVYQQPSPNTQQWNASGQWRWTPQSPPMNAPNMVPMYPMSPQANEVIYPSHPYQPEMTELPMDMPVMQAQAESAIVPAGMDQQATMNRPYVPDVAYHEAMNVIPRVNTMKMNGPKKSFVSRGRQRSTPLRNSKPGGYSSVNGAGMNILTKDEMKMDGVGMVSSPTLEK
ncbi:uncharacterized protein LOC102801643 [Saccoglossus kowalevskii]|uniref:Protein boule-like n=1 Tax=Saccoglossus kowalevskii TaxID=10224 RepID=A0ABM0MFM6_SACKO|nr:PREDICTED: protein boule-like [Saccoglossus kowalevskii]